jgi:hypothetical protein
LWAGFFFIYKKNATGEHAEYEDVAAPLRELLS